MSVICVDFDGTCVTHEFPGIGKDIGAVLVLNKLVDHGHKIILFTMRSDNDSGASKEFPGVHGGSYLTDAVRWFHDNRIPLYGINMNPDQTWSNSPKVYAELYIDDAALGCPLKMNCEISERPFVDWDAVDEYLTLEGYFGHIIK